MMSAASISPRWAACMQAIVSMPLVVGSVTPSVSSIRRSTSAAKTGFTPIVPMPCTLE